MTRLPWKTQIRKQLSRALRPVEAWSRKRLLLCADRVSARRFRAQPDAARVLLVRVDNIGDFVLWLDAARALAEHYRAAGRHVTLLANAGWSQWAAECNLFDQVIGVEERRFRRDARYRMRVARQLRQGRYGTAVRASNTRVLESNESLLRLSGAAERLGTVGTFDQGTSRDRRISDGWYSTLFPNELQGVSEMRANAALVRAVTERAYSAQVADLRPHLALELPSALASELEGRRYFVLFPGATFAGRLWPAERFAALAQRLQQGTGWVGVVCGGPSETEQAERICTQAFLLNWTGRTSLAQLAAVLAGAEVVIGNETSAIHIAAAVGTRSVCLLGGGHYGRFAPYQAEALDDRPLPVTAMHNMVCFGCDWKCVFHPAKGDPVPCIQKISVQDAWAALQSALNPPDTAAKVRRELVELRV